MNLGLDFGDSVGDGVKDGLGVVLDLGGDPNTGVSGGYSNGLDFRDLVGNSSGVNLSLCDLNLVRDGGGGSLNLSKSIVDDLSGPGMEM